MADIVVTVKRSSVYVKPRSDRGRRWIEDNVDLFVYRSDGGGALTRKSDIPSVSRKASEDGVTAAVEWWG